jgi:translation initiation factor 2 beta subunit (eIF-2beta)/eIF-5
MESESIIDQAQINFISEVTNLKKLCGGEITSNTRGQNMIPKLSYSTQGKWTYVINYQSLCKHISRSLKFLGKFFASKLGTPYQISETEFKLRGSNKIITYKHIENLLYTEEVLCYSCKSPDTVRDELSNQIKCTSCQKTRILN